MNKRVLIISATVSILCALFMSVGHSVDVSGELRLNGAFAGIFFVTLAVIFVLLYLDLINSDRISAFIRGRSTVTLPFWATWLIILAGWIPVLLAEFPGFFVYDAVDEYVSFATRTFTTHHPLLHTLLLGGSVYGAEVVLGSANAGICIFVIAQMIVISLIFAWIVDTQKTFRLTSVLYYALFPTVVMFALCSAKDALFSAALTAAVVIFLRMRDVRRTAPDASGRLSTAALAASLGIMLLMRNNALYAFVIWAVVLIIYLLTGDRKTDKKHAASVCIGISCAVAAYTGITLIAVTALHANADGAEHQEMLTVPIQQLARTWSVYADQMTPEDLDLLYTYIPEEGLSHYTPQLSDPVKIYFNNAAYEADGASFRQLWMRGLKSHPVSYLNAWLCTSYGFWYPAAIVNVYEGHQVYTFTYTESSYFGYEVEYPGERHSLIPVIDRFYRWLSLDDDIQRIPVISLFFSMGAMAWFYLMGFGVFAYRRDTDALMAFALPALVWLTFLPGPTFLPRYAVYLWFLLPAFCDRLTTQRSIYA